MTNERQKDPKVKLLIQIRLISSLILRARLHERGTPLGIKISNKSQKILSVESSDIPQEVPGREPQTQLSAQFLPSEFR